MDKILYMWINGSILIAVILCFRHFFSHQVPKRFMVFLWCLCLARLLLPISISVQLPVNRIQNPPAESRVRQVIPSVPDQLFRKEVLYDASSDKVSKAADTTLKENIWIGNVIFSIWLAVAIFLALKIIIRHIRSCRIYRLSVPVCEEKAAEWLHTHRSFRKVTLRKSEFVGTPLTYGIFRPVILLPSEIKFSEEEFLCIMEHEWVHIRWWDVLLKYILYLTVCIYWFHPMVWAMVVLLNRDIEMACDEEVIKKYSGSLKSTYALVLIRLAEGRRDSIESVNACFASRLEIEERIQMIMKSKKYSQKAVALAIIMTFCAATTFTAFAQNSPEEANVSSEGTQRDGDDVKNVQKDSVKTNTDASSTVKANKDSIKTDDRASATAKVQGGTSATAKAQEDSMETDADASDTENIQRDSVVTDADASDTINIQRDSAETDADISNAENVEKESSETANMQIAKLAESYIGASYQFDGVDLSVGVDSPGFVKAIYAQAGIELPGDINGQAASGTEISLEELSAGDVIFYGEADEDQNVLNHAGIYNGSGKVIHASNAKDGVKISDFNYRPISKAVRILK